MATLYLTEQQALVKKDGDTLLVSLPADKATGRPKKDVRVPLMKIDRVVVQGNATLTSPAIAALMERRAEITFLDLYGRYQGHLTPAFSKNGQLRLAQTAAHVDPARQVALARAFVLGKAANMRTMLLRANRKRENEALATARTEAAKIIASARADIQKDLDAATAKADAEISAKAAESEKRISEIRAGALEAVEAVAKDTARELVAALGGTADAKSVTAAVAARLKG